MHEWKITEAIIEEILKQAEANGIKKVNKVVLSIGQDSDLTPETIGFCFDSLKPNYPINKDLILEFKNREGMGGVIIETIEGED